MPESNNKWSYYHSLCTNVANATAVCQSGGSEVLVEAIYANMSNPQELNAVLSVISLMAVRNDLSKFHGLIRILLFSMMQADATCARLLVNAGTIEAILDGNDLGIAFEKRTSA